MNRPQRNNIVIPVKAGTIVINKPVPSTPFRAGSERSRMDNKWQGLLISVFWFLYSVLHSLTIIRTFLRKVEKNPNKSPWQETRIAYVLCGISNSVFLIFLPLKQAFRNKYQKTSLFLKLVGNIYPVRYAVYIDSGNYWSYLSYLMGWIPWDTL